MLKNGRPFGRDYFDELLEKIREIRASERHRDYYTAEDTELWGDGDYGAEGTYNMVKIVGKGMILETPRLTLRPLTLDDAETAFYGWTGDAESNKWVSWLPHHSIDDAIAWLNEISWEQPVMNNSCRDNYIWGFVSKETDELFGSGGLIWEEDYQLYQVGYNINKAYWNKGYTTEAMRAIFEYASKTLGIKRLAGGHAKANPASGAVLKKLGFVYDRDDIVPHVDGVRSFDSREYYLDLEAHK